MIEAEQTLAGKCLLGDRQAFEELVRTTSRTLFAYLYLETADHQLAEDLVQDTYLSAWRSIHTLADPRRVRPWLFAIAHRAMVDGVRRRRRKKRGGDVAHADSLLNVPDAAPSPHDAAHLSEQRQRVLAALRAMPREYREPLTLRYLAGADYQTIGRELAISNGSLRGLLSRGMALLRDRLKE